MRKIFIMMGSIISVLFTNFVSANNTKAQFKIKCIEKHVKEIKPSEVMNCVGDL